MLYYRQVPNLSQTNLNEIYASQTASIERGGHPDMEFLHPLLDTKLETNWLALSLLILLQWGQTFGTNIFRHRYVHARASWIQMNLAPTHWKIHFWALLNAFWNWIALRHIDFKSHLALRLSMLPTPQAAAGQQASQKKTGCKDQSGRCFQAQHRKRRFRIRHHTSDGISFIPRKAVSHSLQKPRFFRNVQSKVLAKTCHSAQTTCKTYLAIMILIRL